jgi:hypothetical protein
MVWLIRKYRDGPTMRAIPRKVRLERIQHLFSQKALKEILDDKFIDGLQKRRDDLQSRILKILGVEVTILGIMLICLTPLHLNVTLFGVQASDLRQLRELLLVIFSSLGFRSFQWRAESTFVREVMHAALMAKAKNDQELLFILQHRFGIGGFPDHPLFQPATNMMPAFGYRAVRGLLDFTSFAINIVTGLAFLAIEVAIMVDVYRAPSFGVRWSIIVIAYSVLVTTASMLWNFLRTSPFTYRAPEG